MTDDLSALRAETEAALAAAADLRAWDAVRVATLGQAGTADRAAEEPRRDAARATARARRRAQPAEGRTGRRDRAPRAGAGARRAGRTPRRRADRRHPAARAPPDRPHPPDQPHHGGDGRHLRRDGLRGRRGPGRRDRLAQFRRAQHPRAPPRARRPRHVLPARRARRPAACCCARRPATVQIRTMLDAAAADPHHRAGPHLPRRPRRHALADVPPGRGPGASTATSRSAT